MQVFEKSFYFFSQAIEKISKRIIMNIINKKKVNEYVQNRIASSHHRGQPMLTLPYRADRSKIY
jgi:hypothetical protein